MNDNTFRPSIYTFARGRRCAVRRAATNKQMQHTGPRLPEGKVLKYVGSRNVVTC